MSTAADALRRSICRPVSAVPWALFRIAASAVLVAEYAHLLYFRSFLVPPGAPNWVPRLHALAFVGASLGLLTSLGLFTRATTILGYGCAAITFGVVAPRLGFGYHADGYLILGSLLMVVCPVGSSISVDCALRRRSQTAATFSGAYTALLLVAMSAVYLDAFTWKVNTPMWREGLGVWAPSSQPFATYLDVGFLGFNELIVRLLGWSVLAFQVAFPALVWSSRTRPLVVLVGMGMHAAIGFTFPIPLFGLIVVAFYLPIVPSNVYRKLGISVPDAVQSAGAAPWLPMALSAIWLLSWPLINLQSAFHDRWFSDPVTTIGRMEIAARRASNRYVSIVYPLTGMGPHPVFLPIYFENHSTEYRLSVVHDGREEDVPIVTDEGTMGAYGFNRNWCVWSFFNYSPTEAAMRPMIARVVLFWATEHHVDMKNASVRIYERTADVDLVHWHRDTLARNRDRQWHLGDE